MRRAIDRSITRAYVFAQIFHFSFSNPPSPSSRIEETRGETNSEKKKWFRLFHRLLSSSTLYNGSRPSARAKHREKKKKEKKYQFQLRRESIISVKGILAHFGAEPPPPDRPPHPFRWLWKNVGAREVIDPWLPSGRRSRTTSNGWYESTRADLRSHSGFCSRSASALSPFPSYGTIRSFQIFFMKICTHVHHCTRVKTIPGRWKQPVRILWMGREKARSERKRTTTTLLAWLLAWSKKSDWKLSADSIADIDRFSLLTFRYFTKYQKLMSNRSFLYNYLYNFSSYLYSNQTWARMKSILMLYKWKSLSKYDAKQKQGDRIVKQLNRVTGNHPRGICIYTIDFSSKLEEVYSSEGKESIYRLPGERSWSSSLARVPL